MGEGTSAYPLGYYQQVLLAFREFVDDEEYEEGKRRWGEALSEFEVISSNIENECIYFFEILSWW